jgi:hypothetical protein
MTMAEAPDAVKPVRLSKVVDRETLCFVCHLVARESAASRAYIGGSSCGPAGRRGS